MTLRCGFRRRRGDVAEVDALYATVGPRPLCCSRAMGGGDAEDVASQGWLQLVRDLPAVRDSCGFGAGRLPSPGTGPWVACVTTDDVAPFLLRWTS